MSAVPIKTIVIKTAEVTRSFVVQPSLEGWGESMGWVWWLIAILFGVAVVFGAMAVFVVLAEERAKKSRRK